MKHKIFFVLVIGIILPFNLFSQTHISAESNISGRWTLQNSPFIIEGKVIVPKGKTLVVEAGVEIKFNTLNKLDYKSFSKRNRGYLHIEGVLKAIGTIDNPIIFTKNGNSEYWGAIYFKESDNSEFKYCKIDYAGGITDVGGVNQDAFGAISIQNCNPKISNIDISNTVTGIYISENASPLINNTYITKCKKSGVLCVENSRPTFQNTAISYSYFGVRCEAASPTFINCNIIHNQNYGFMLYQQSSLQINNCIVWGNKYAFDIYFNTTINQSIIQDKIARVITGKNKDRIRAANIIGVPIKYLNLNVLLIENNKLGLDINQNNVKANIGILIENNENSITDLQEINQIEIKNEKLDISDVDKNIPINNSKLKYRYALVIGNEDYTRFQTNLSNEINVDYANNDAEIFAKYCKLALGVPNDNIFLLKDAISTQIKREVEKISKMIMYSQGKAEIIFYYAGHGIPHELTKEPYIVPVDVAGDNLEDGVALSWLYKKFTEYDSKLVTIFIDACFSGGARNQGLIAARGVKVKPKENAISGNCIVFTSSSDIQSSLSFKKMNHGMFTYYLLKKLKESCGSISFGELSDYLYENVALNSLKVNGKEQTPKTLVSPNIVDNWRSLTLIKK